jgi:hypothetical protein
MTQTGLQYKAGNTKVHRQEIWECLECVQLHDLKLNLKVKNLIFLALHKDKAAASFCYQEAARVPYIFCNFYVVKDHQIANNLTTTKAREKLSTYLKLIEF